MKTERVNFMRKAICIMAAVALVFGCMTASYADKVLDGGFETNLLNDEKTFEIGIPVYRVGGSEPERLSAGDVITMSLDGKWLGEEMSGMIAVCVLYNEKGTAKAMSYAEPSDTGGNGFRCEVQLAVPETLEEGKYRLSTYIWQGLKCEKIFTEGVSYCDGANTEVKNTEWKGISGTISLSSEEKYEGLSSLKIKSVQPASQNAAVIETNVPAAGVWRLSFAAKGSSAFGYDVIAPDGTSLIADGEKTFETSEDWYLPSDGVFDTGNAKTVRIVFNDKAASGVSYVDSVSLEKSLFREDDFELSGSSRSGTFAVAPDRVYTLKFNSIGDEYTVYIRQDGRVIAHISAPASNDPSATSMDFYADSACRAVEYEIFSDGYVQISNLSVAQATSDIIVNGDFESGSQTLWYIRNAVYGNKLVLIEGKNGKYGIKLTKRNNVFNGIEQNISKGLNRFGTGEYKISGYVRFDGADASGEVAVKVMTQKTPQKLYVLKPIPDVRNDWVYFEEIINIAEFGADESAEEFSDTAVVFVNTNSGVYDLCIDDFKMEAVGRNPEPPVYTEIEG